MRATSLLFSCAGHALALTLLATVSLALSRPPPPEDLTTIRVSLASLPLGRSPGAAPSAKAVAVPAPPSEPKPAAATPTPPKPVEPAPKKKEVRPVKPVTKAEAAQKPAEQAPPPQPQPAGTQESAPAPDAQAQPGAPAPDAATASADLTGPAAQPVGGAGSVMARGESGAGDAYLGLVQTKIGRRWQPSSASASGRTFAEAVVGFRIGPGGEVLDVAIVQSSELSVFDREALRAVTESSPMPPPPMRFRAGGLSILFTFTYRP
jgi:protein TonB